MLILCSNGLSSDNLLNEVRKYTKNAKKAALVVTADNEYKEKNYHVERVTNELKKLELSIEYFDIDFRTPKELLNYDVVEFIGGNPFYLLNSLRKTNAKPVLKELMEKKVLIGWSAGAIVMCKTLELVNKYTPEMNFLNLDDLTGMDLTDIEILPHYSRYINKFEMFEKKCKQYEIEKKCHVIRINDGDGIAIAKRNANIIKK